MKTVLLHAAAVALAVGATEFTLDEETTSSAPLYSPHADAHYTVSQRTFYSDPIELKAGHMVFTNPRETKLKMPTGRYMLTYFIGDIVDADTKQPVPLSQLYDHHWIAKASTHENKLCHGGARGKTKIEYVFGIGAESRNSPVSFPPGYGYEVTAGTEWGANIHLLRTEGLAGANPYKAAKECNECYWALGKGAQCTPAKNGTFDCCGERDTAGVMKCPTVLFPPPPRSYRLRYTFNFTRDVDALTPVYVGVMAAPNCETFYGVQHYDPYHVTDDVHRVSYTLKIPARANVLLAIGHIHTGGLNITLSKNGQHVCTSLPTYGTEMGVAGNEKGYLVKMDACVAPSTTGELELKKGDEVTIDGYYYVGHNDTRLLYSDGTHLNVMSYMYTAYYRPKESLAANEDAEFWARPAPLPEGELPADW